MFQYSDKSVKQVEVDAEEDEVYKMLYANEEDEDEEEEKEALNDLEEEASLKEALQNEEPLDYSKEGVNSVFHEFKKESLSRPLHPQSDISKFPLATNVSPVKPAPIEPEKQTVTSAETAT